MARGLLLGNGINSRIGIAGLSVMHIAEKFVKNVSVYSVLIEKVFGVQIRNDFGKILELPISELGIESLAGLLYKYVKKSKKEIWTCNDEYRLQDLITCICLTSIFYDKTGKIRQNFDKNKMISINDYDYIYTLNYVEFWDNMHKCIYLHGKIEWSELPDKKDVIFVSSGRMKLKKYADAVEGIRMTNSIVNIYPNDIIFAPAGVNKDKLICTSGIYPSDKLYPADDLFLYRGKELYTELDLVDELDIFGMSPFGDESIINKLNQKNKIRVFIYNKKTNDETKVWEIKLTCNYELLDANSIK